MAIPTRRATVSDGQGRVTQVEYGYLDCADCGSPLPYADAEDGLPVNWEPRRSELLGPEGDPLCGNCRYDRRVWGGAEGAARAEAWFSRR